MSKAEFEEAARAALARKVEQINHAQVAPLGEPKVSLSGKEGERKLSARFPCGHKLVVKEHPHALRARIVERPE